LAVKPLLVTFVAEVAVGGSRVAVGVGVGVGEGVARGVPPIAIVAAVIMA
jgi:hypothetical protein